MIARLATVRPAPAEAERNMLAATSMDVLEEIWWRDCSHWPDESAERERLLGVYQDKSAQFAVEVAKRMLV